MNNLLAARSQMGMSLAFHIIFAAIGIALPLMMVIAEWRWIITKDEAYLLLAKRWAKGTTILAAVGAVSGTVLSFELGLLWPQFMRHAGAIIGMPFSLEGFAFFTEAIFLGIYLYGWNRVPSWFHFLSGVIVALSGLLSAMFVTLVNGWMNTPTGFVFADGSLLAFHDPNAVVKGLDQFPEADWPNVRIVHLCFQTMVGCGSILSLFSLVAFWFHRKGRLFSFPAILLVILVSPLGFVALEAGWMVTELGRQPWIIYQLLRTRDAVTSLPHILVTFILMTLLYLILGATAAWLLAKHVIASPGTRVIEREEETV